MGPRHPLGTRSPDAGPTSQGRRCGHRDDRWFLLRCDRSRRLARLDVIVSFLEQDATGTWHRSVDTNAALRCRADDVERSGQFFEESLWRGILPQQPSNTRMCSSVAEVVLTRGSQALAQFVENRRRWANLTRLDRPPRCAQRVDARRAPPLPPGHPLHLRPSAGRRSLRARWWARPERAAPS